MENNENRPDDFFIIKKKNHKGKKKQVSFHLYQDEIDVIDDLSKKSGQTKSYVVSRFINGCKNKAKVIE